MMIGSSKNSTEKLIIRENAVEHKKKKPGLSANGLYHRKFKYFLLISFSFTNKYKTFGSYFSVHELSHLKSLYFVVLVMGYSRKNPHPHYGRHSFLTPPPPPSIWISKTAWAPLHSGFPSWKTPAPIWISIKLLDTVILLYTQCGRIL